MAKSKAQYSKIFSILIPTWNNFPYLKLCLESIRKNSAAQHQVLVFVNEGDDETIEWLKGQDISYLNDPENRGICIALNKLRPLADEDYLVYMNDDMYVCPGWDISLAKAIEEADNNKFFFSSTMIEPVDTGNNCVISPADFGTTHETFRENDLLKQFQDFKKADWSGATWPPNVVHKEMWDKVNGYSEEFSPGLYSDPDFSMKLWKEGVRVFKGISDSRVYHFGSKSTGKAKLNPGKKQFLEKWGIGASTFKRFYLRSGKKYEGNLADPSGMSFKIAVLKDKMKRSL